MILLLGSSGYVGTAVLDHLRARGVDHQTLSLRNSRRDPRDLLYERIRQHRPDFLICAAGFTGDFDEKAGFGSHRTAAEAIRRG